MSFHTYKIQDLICSACFTQVVCMVRTAGLMLSGAHDCMCTFSHFLGYLVSPIPYTWRIRAYLRWDTKLTWSNCSHYETNMSSGQIQLSIKVLGLCNITGWVKCKTETSWYGTVDFWLYQCEECLTCFFLQDFLVCLVDTLVIYTLPISQIFLMLRSH